MSTGHIRPKVRKAGKQPNPPASRSPAQDDQAVEDVRIKLDNWMGISDDKPRAPNASEAMFPSSIEIPTPAIEMKQNASSDGAKTVPAESSSISTGKDQDNDENNEKAPALKGILKKPKYSKPREDHSTEGQPKPKKSIFKQDCIRERDPTTSQNKQIQFNPKHAASAAMAVEGYQPTMDHNKRIKSETSDDEEGGEPMIFSSIADLMQAAGTLPSQDLENNPQVVEADLAFSCMAPDDYKTGLILQGMEQQEQESQAKEDPTPDWKKPLPKPMVSLETDNNNNPVSDDDEAETYDGDDDNVFFDLMDDDNGEESEEDPVVVAPPRAFRVIWECLSPLITHESCTFLRRLKQEQDSGSSYLITTTPFSDLETSRSNGFMTMLQMYISRALKELDQPPEMRRTAEQRLQGLLYTFNFSRPAAKLETKQWKALTCVLLEIVLFLNQHASNEGKDPPLPASVTAVGMSPDEYRYLVNNTIQTFDIPDPVI